ncbi:hypothetical protein D3C76_1741560 [compost metagenome]
MAPKTANAAPAHFRIPLALANNAAPPINAASCSRIGHNGLALAASVRLSDCIIIGIPRCS